MKIWGDNYSDAEGNPQGCGECRYCRSKYLSLPERRHPTDLGVWRKELVLGVCDECQVWRRQRKTYSGCFFRAFRAFRGQCV